MKQVETIIVGAGLTGLSTALFLNQKTDNFLILEKSNRIGGNIQTIHKDGFVIETGPNTGTISTTELIELFDLLPEIVPEIANEKAKKRWIWKKGAWHPLPYNLRTAIFTPLFSLKDKLGILLEPFRSKGKNPYESVAALVKRRLGNSIYNYAIDPFISGIYAGDPQRLITKFALPKLYNLEQNYGSFIKGAIQKAKLPKSELEKRANKKIFSIEGGLSRLPEAIHTKIGTEKTLLEVQITKIIKSEQGYRVIYKHNGQEEIIVCKNLISTVPAFEIANLLDLNQTKLEEFKTLHHPKVVEIVVGYKKWDGIKLNAFGGLVPSKEQKDVLGALFLSTLFKNRCPQGGAMITYFIGGAKSPEFYDKSNEELIELINTISQEMFDATIADSDLIHITKYEKAIPQYEIDSEKRFALIEQIENQYPNLYLRGSMIDGISMADRVKQAKWLSEAIKK